MRTLLHTPGRWVALCLLLAAAGCASNGSSLHLRSYRPSSEGRQPWLWAQNTAVPPKTGTVKPPANGGTESPSRVLKRGDTITIHKRGIPKPEDIKDEIDGTGNVNLALIGTVHVEGLTTAEAEKLIEKHYIDGGFYRKISIIIVPQADTYYVGGEVERPNRYPLSGDITLLAAIMTAGDYTKYANARNITVLRGKKILKFDGKDIRAGKTPDPAILPNDIVTVHPRKW